MTDQDIAVQLPAEQTPITLFGLPCLAVRAIDGAIYLAIRIFSPDTARRLREKWSGNGV